MFLCMIIIMLRNTNYEVLLINLLQVFKYLQYNY